MKDMTPLEIRTAMRAHSRRKRKESCRVNRDSSRVRRAIRADLVEQQEGRCYWCNKPMGLADDMTNPHRATLEHLLPLSKGGRNVQGNQVAAGKSCNLARGNTTHWKPKLKLTDAPEKDGF